MQVSRFSSRFMWPGNKMNYDTPERVSSLTTEMGTETMGSELNKKKNLRKIKSKNKMNWYFKKMAFSHRHTTRA